MQRTRLNSTEYAQGDASGGIAACTHILQEAADFLFSRPALEPGTYFIHQSDTQPDHRVILGDASVLQIPRPYMVGFYGLRAPDPDGELTKDLLGVDERLIESLLAFGVGVYNTAQLHGEYINTAVLRDRGASKRWGADNQIHRGAVEKLAPRCYRQVLKLTGYVDGWPQACRIDLDEVVLIA